MSAAPELQPGDWHETLVDLLAMDRGIPEDRARRFLARHAEEVHAATPVTCHARECPCPPGCSCCRALPASQDVAHWELAAQKNGWRLYSGAENQRDAAPDLNTQLTEAEALAGRWEEKYFEMGEKRTADALAIQRVRNLLPPDPTEDDLCVGVRNSVLRATLGSLTEEQQHWEDAAQENGELYSSAENQRDAAREQLAEARATIARCQAVARDWEFMSGRTAARRELLAALNNPKETRDV